MQRQTSLTHQIQKAFKKLIGGFVALSFILMSTVIAVATLYNQERETQKYLELITAAFDIELNNAISQTDLLADTPLASLALEGSVGRDVYLNSLVREINNGRPHKIELYDFKGRPFISANTTTDKTDISEVLQDAIQNGALRSRLSTGRYDPILLAAFPIISARQGKPTGYAVLHFEVNHVLEHFQLPKDMNLKVLDTPSGENPSILSQLFTRTASSSVRAQHQGHTVALHFELSERTWDNSLFAFGMILLLAAGFLLTLERANRWAANFGDRISERLGNVLRFSREILASDKAKDLKPDTEPDEIGALSISLEELLRKERNYEQKLFNASYTDDLTGLPNYRAFKEKLAERIASEGPGASFCVLFIDLINLKGVNEAYGYEVGDQAIHKAGAHLAARLPEGHFLCRRSADEFSALIDDPGSSEALIQQLDRVITDAKVSVGHTTRTITTLQFSIGVARYPKDATNERDILIAAGAALQECKKTRRSRVILFDERIQKTVIRKYILQQKIKKLLDEHGFFLYYQPKVDMRNGQIVGFEALVRMPDPDEGFISPEEFIPIAEEANQIEYLTEQLLQRLLHDRDTIQSKFPGTKLSFNISTRLFNENRFLKIAADTLGEAQEDYTGIVFEITETELAQNLQVTLTQLSAIIGLGAEISIDDFGKGYSSLSRLADFPVHELKIDASFVRSYDLTSNDKMIRGIVGIARSLGLEIIAEGVETKSQEDMLILAGCFKAQGWRYAKALPLHEVLRLPGKITLRDE